MPARNVHGRRNSLSLTTFDAVGHEEIRLATCSLVSPNVVDETMGFDETAAAIRSERQVALADVYFPKVDDILGLKSTCQNSIGAWPQGVENSAIVDYSPKASLEQIRVSAAMKGLISEQKQVIAFKGDPQGSAVMYVMKLPGDNAKALHEALSKGDIEYHTLVPHKKGFEVRVFDSDGSLAETITAFGEKNHVKVKTLQGHGEFIPPKAADREAGRKAYEDVIGAFAGVGHGADVRAFERLRDNWFSRDYVKFLLDVKFNEINQEGALAGTLQAAKYAGVLTLRDWFFKKANLAGKGQLLVRSLGKRLRRWQPLNRLAEP